MKIRSILAGAAVAAAAFVPAAALADLQVNANGFERVVATSTQGDSCEVERQRAGDGTSVDCPDGARGTLLLYRTADEAAVCEVDFWYAGNGSGTPKWRAQISHANGANGTCALHWNDPATLNLTVQPANSPA